MGETVDSVSDVGFIAAYVYAGELPKIIAPIHHASLCVMVAPIRACSPIRAQGDIVGWHIPRLQGQCVAGGVAAWVRFRLPFGEIVDRPLSDFGIGDQEVKPLVNLITLENVRVYISWQGASAGVKQ